MPTCRDCSRDYIGHDLTVRCPDCAKRVVDADRGREQRPTNKPGGRPLKTTASPAPLQAFSRRLDALIAKAATK